VLVLRLSGAVLAISVLAAASSFAQSPTSPSPTSSLPASSLPGSPSLPVRGFVPPYEILRTLRAAGFDPLAPPLRQGTIYVVRAIDYRGVAMRVVVDAHSGAIRDANRIVSGLGLYGPYAPGPYAPPHYGRLGAASPYPPPDELAVYGRPPYAGTAEPPTEDDNLDGAQRSLGSTGSILVPLPRPRPAVVGAATGVSKTGSVAKQPAKPDIAVSAPIPRSEPPNTAAKAPALPEIND
jgi:hypothetical protein